MASLADAIFESNGPGDERQKSARTRIHDRPDAIRKDPIELPKKLQFRGRPLSALQSRVEGPRPAGLAALLLLMRTQWEDGMLQAELADYAVYTQRIRFD